jgi:hypothetical protein
MLQHMHDVIQPHDMIGLYSYRNIGCCNVRPRSSTVVKLNFFTVLFELCTFFLDMTQLYSISNRTYIGSNLVLYEQSCHAQFIECNVYYC